MKNFYKNVQLLLIALTFGLTYGQLAQNLPAPISELTLNSNNQIACTIHTNDNAAVGHHSLGSAKAALAAKGNKKASLKSKKGASGAQIFVDFYNFDPTFLDADFAAASFQSAVDIWAANLDSEVDIFVAAVFQPLDPGVLGSAGPTRIYANAEGLERDTWYGNALADKLVGADLDPTLYDIVANFSTVFPNWYFGTDGNPPTSDFDFRTVVLHELGHGLGFFGSMFVDNTSGVGDYGFGIPDPVYPAIYDRLANSSDGKSILKERRYGNFTTDLGDVLLDGPLTAKGPRIKKATNGKGAKLFTILDSKIFGDIPGLTDEWLPGSSYSHMDFRTYRGTANGLMVPFLSRGLSFNEPGNITLAIFDDMGWNGKVNREVMANNRDKNKGGDGLALYPNPFVNTVELSLGDDSRSISKAVIYDANGIGMEVPNSKISGGATVTIDMTSFVNTSDLYFLKVTFSDGDIMSYKLYRDN